MSNSRGPETLAHLVAALGPRALAATSAQAAATSDLAVVAIPFRNVARVPVQQTGKGRYRRQQLRRTARRPHCVLYEFAGGSLTICSVFGALSRLVVGGSCPCHGGGATGRPSNNSPVHWPFMLTLSGHFANGCGYNAFASAASDQSPQFRVMHRPSPRAGIGG
jgi:hypothetical protein